MIFNIDSEGFVKLADSQCVPQPHRPNRVYAVKNGFSVIVGLSDGSKLKLLTEFFRPNVTTRALSLEHGVSVVSINNK